MDFPFVEYIPLCAVLVQKKTGLIVHANSKIKQEFDVEITEQNIKKFFSVEDLSNNSEINNVKFFINQSVYKIGKLTIESINEEYQLICFQEDCALNSNRYKEIFELATDGIIVVNKNLKVLEVNKAFCEISEIPKNELINKNALSLVSKFAEISVLRPLLSAINKAIKEKRNNGIDVPYKGKILSITMSSQKDKPYYLGLIKDVTARVVSKQEIEKSEKKYKTLINTSYDSIAIIEDGIIVFANPTLEQISGHPQKELIGKPFINFVFKEERSKVLKYYEQRINNKKAPERYQSKAITKNNEIIDVDVSVIPIQHEGKNAVQIILRDISERVKAETALKLSEEKFKFLTESTFEGIIVHKKGKVIDINDAFTAITGYKKEEAIGENLLDYIQSKRDKATNYGQYG